MERHGDRLCIGKLPGRKRPCLYLWDALGIRVVAFFADQAAADATERFLEGCANDGARMVWVADQGGTDAETREAISKVMEGFDRGVFVRNTVGDGDPAWAVKLFPYLRALGVLQRLTDIEPTDEWEAAVVRTPAEETKP